MCQILLKLHILFKKWLTFQTWSLTQDSETVFCWVHLWSFFQINTLLKQAGPVFKSDHKIEKDYKLPIILTVAADAYISSNQIKFLDKK